MRHEPNAFQANRAAAAVPSAPRDRTFAEEVSAGAEELAIALQETGQRIQALASRLGADLPPSAPDDPNNLAVAPRGVFDGLNRNLRRGHDEVLGLRALLTAIERVV